MNDISNLAYNSDSSLTMMPYLSYGNQNYSLLSCTDLNQSFISNMNFKNTDNKSTELCINVKKHKLKLNFEL